MNSFCGANRRNIEHLEWYFAAKPTRLGHINLNKHPGQNQLIHYVMLVESEGWMSNFWEDFELILNAIRP